MAEFRGLPDDFDPERYSRERPLGELVEPGTTTLMEVLVTKRASDAPDGGAGKIRCWRCYRQPDGSWDCISIPCPPSWPPPTHVVKE
jgi:hypothetical protein